MSEHMKSFSCSWCGNCYWWDIRLEQGLCPNVFTANCVVLVLSQSWIQKYICSTWSSDNDALLESQAYLKSFKLGMRSGSCRAKVILRHTPQQNLFRKIKARMRLPTLWITLNILVLKTVTSTNPYCPCLDKNRIGVILSILGYTHQCKKKKGSTGLLTSLLLDRLSVKSPRASTRLDCVSKTTCRVTQVTLWWLLPKSDQPFAYYYKESEISFFLWKNKFILYQNVFPIK